MVDIKREDITLSDWTKGISADEFAWGSYFYSEAISSGYNTKGFELWYRISKRALNSRSWGNALSLSPTDDYWFMAFTRDGRIETEDFWNWASSWTWDENGGWAIFATLDWGIGYWYLNWVTYWDLAIWIKQTRIDVVDIKNAYDPTAEVLGETDMSIATGWTLGTWWTIGDTGVEHTNGETWDLEYDITAEWYTTSSYVRFAVKISDRTAWSIDATIGNNTVTFNEQVDGWYVWQLRWKPATTTLTISPSSDFDWIINIVNLHLYDTANDYVMNSKVTLSWWAYSDKHPALIREWDLYVASRNYVNIISLQDWGQTYKTLVDKNFTIVSMTQQAWNIILRATDGYDSRQYYWNWVDAVATEVIEWKGLIIQWVTGTETISYVLTTSGRNVGSVEWYEYRLYAVSGYQRNLIASKLYQFRSDDYLEIDHYNANKKFDFNDVTSDQSMTIFLDSLYIPWCDWVYKYGYDIPWLRSNWTRPIKYDTWATNIVMGQRGHFLGVWFTLSGTNYICNVDNRLYPETWFLVSESLYWDKLWTRKAIEKLKIWYKNVPSSVGNIKVYAIVDDTYFWRFRPTSTPTTRPAVWDIYTVANNTTAKVIDVNTIEGVITLVTVNNGWSYAWLANTSLTKVSGAWDDTISVGYNYDNMCLIKTIESEQQQYGSDLIFWKNFVNNYLPYRYKLQLVIELNSNDRYISPEVYEISMVSDIADTIL